MDNNTTAAPVIDLIGLIERSGKTKLKYAASTDGGEYVGPCPFCGQGTDRFHVWPHSAKRPHYWCRVNPDHKGDAIQFLKDFEGMTFREACNELGLDYMDGADIEYIGTLAPPQTDQPPPAKWRELMQYLVDKGNKVLLAGATPIARQYREYLTARGIKLEMVEKKQISFAAIGSTGRWLEIPFSDVGLTEDMVSAKQWEKGCIRIPDGLIFPYQVQGDLWKLGIKRPFVTDGTMPRGQILGSKECLLNEDLINPNMPVLMTEAFLDAISVEQEAGDLIVPISTDGTSNGRSARCIMRLKYADYIIQSFDNDPAGDKAADEWKNLLANTYRWRPCIVKDTNEMLTDKQDVRDWVAQGMGLATHKLAEQADEAVFVEKVAAEAIDPAEPDLDIPDHLLNCVICGAIVDIFTTKGTPCCWTHYPAQQQIEELMEDYDLERDQLPALELSPEQIQERFRKELSFLGPCDVQVYDGTIPLKEIMRIRLEEIQQDRAKKEADERQKVIQNQLARREKARFEIQSQYL